MEWLGLAAIFLLILLAWGSYADTRARVIRIEWNLELLLRHHGIDPSQGFPLSDAVRRLADDPAKKIEAIRQLRAETGFPLWMAKRAVEVYQSSLKRDPAKPA